MIILGCFVIIDIVCLDSVVAEQSKHPALVRFTVLQL